MKQKIIYIITIILFTLSCSLLCFSQDNLNTEQLLSKIKTLRKADTQSMPSSEERIHYKALLILYKGFINSLNGKNREEVEKYKQEIINAQNTILSLEVILNTTDEPQSTFGNFVPIKDESQPDEEPKKSKEKQLSQLPQPKTKPTPKTEVIQVDTKVNKYTDAPKALVSEVDKVMASIQFHIAENDDSPEDEVSAAFPQLFSFSLANTVFANDKDNPVSTMEPVRFFLETARTDKQIGASSSTGAATSSIEKPGFASLLGLAVENGAIEQNVQDTVLTLSTSPSALFSIAERDTTQAYKNAGIFNRIGVSASFNINSQNPLLASATRGQLRDYSVRFRFYGDRSSRSKELEKIWDEEMTPAIQSLLTPLNAANITLDDALKGGVRLDRQKKLRDKVKEIIESAEFKALSMTAQTEELKNVILNFIKEFVVDPVKENKISVSEPTRAAIKKHFQDLIVAQEGLKVIREEVNKKLDKFFKGPLGTLAYTNHRDVMGNYSDFKVLFEQNDTFFKPLKLVANGGFSFYHKPNQMMNQKKLRDVAVALSFEGKILSPLNTDNEDLSQITYSFTGSYRRLFENKGITDRKADLGSFQFLANIPFLRGLIFPFSVTYSNATEFERKQSVRVNFGIKLDTDKLFELAKFNRQFK